MDIQYNYEPSTTMNPAHLSVVDAKVFPVQKVGQPLRPITLDYTLTPGTRRIYRYYGESSVLAQRLRVLCCMSKK